MPADVARLDYYGRELEIWAGRNDLRKLASSRAELRRTWDAVKPYVISHGGAAPARSARVSLAGVGLPPEDQHPH